MKPAVRAAVLSLALMSAASGAGPITTAQIISSTTSVDCLEWRIAGICYWLYCTYYECEVRTSTKYRHYVPDAVVSSYANTGENSWVEVRTMSQPNATALGGQDGTTNHANENNLAKFKNADVIGHPGGEVFAAMMEEYAYSCPGAGTMLFPYFLSTLDFAWRNELPEALYPASFIYGLREVANPLLATTWGNVYPRVGFMHQSDDYQAGAVIAQRAGDIVTRNAQLHVYVPLVAEAKPGYWPAGGLIEGDARTGKWQELTPTLSETCTVFPHTGIQDQATQGDYAWALWRPYACCKREGQVFLFSIDFAP